MIRNSNHLQSQYRLKIKPIVKVQEVRFRALVRKGIERDRERKKTFCFLTKRENVNFLAKADILTEKIWKCL